MNSVVMHSKMLSGENLRADGPFNMCEREHKTMSFASTRATSALSESTVSFVPPFISQLTGLRALPLLAGSGLQALCERNCRSAATSVNLKNRDNQDTRIMLNRKGAPRCA